jgi:dTMP kinase
MTTKSAKSMPHSVGKGCLIVFEGIEGSGKTTASRGLINYLTQKKFKAMWTREPTTSRIGLLIQEILKRETLVAEEAIPILFAADRADHTKRQILPSIKKGYIVVCDRYIHSSLAYQRSGMGKVYKREWLEKINKYAIRPDLVIFLDISPDEGLDRIGKGQRIHDDKFFEDIGIQKRIREAYYTLLNINKPLTNLFKKDIFPNSILSKLKSLSMVDSTLVFCVDALLPQDEVQSIVNDIALRFLKMRGSQKQLEQKQSLTGSLLDENGS